MKKTWIEKRDCEKSFKIKVIDKPFSDMPKGSKMLIVTPQIIDNYLRNIPFGKSIAFGGMRKDLASKYNANHTCPVTTGIFLRIVSEAAYQEFTLGKKHNEITPFWRVVTQHMNLAKKLECGEAFIVKQRRQENLDEEIN